jgi:hypothetical protein
VTTDIVYESFTPTKATRSIPSMHQEAVAANLAETAHRRFRVPAAEALDHKRDINRAARRLNCNVAVRVIPDPDDAGSAFVVFRATPRGTRTAAADTA